MTDRFAGKTVLVTGAAAGLGRAYALKFGAQGAHLILADINADGMVETAAMVEAVGGTAEHHLCDMSDEAQIQALGQAVLAAHDRLDVLINNAGMHMGEIARGFFGLGQAKWQHFFAVNTIGPLLLAEALRPALARAKGLIINKSSMASYQPQTAYGITKAALNVFTHAMASQFAADEIRCVGIAPGLMETPAAKDGVEDANWERLRSMQAVKRQGTADDIANLGIFLASDEGSFINNQVLLCDGGHQLRGFRI
ncbi:MULTISPECIES: SDR family NAD(P)-dependent oxidoreductase [Blastomonas]|jgi:3-oxoacyl-[acyl-carrier protein] reductase|uniref:Short-chain dehydrogenase n=3 Tax=Blastomonas fulva TaxID=1550728 RepID=A0ABN5B5D0_9SPHN|nr:MULTISPECIES: SDR family oxidoreductase [Blastomonas]AOG01329.1 short chain dehydrogenase family protein [Blastomonas sp. RAC04]ASR52287.1 short-chain dehydrogenase [Blastomonas fulva]MDM7929392.1 SDR family oxidoreductase [Blastomonas fulva]MDM7965353.1 SDR family oxidoreductase [Blastomonas fulva]